MIVRLSVGDVSRAYSLARRRNGSVAGYGVDTRNSWNFLEGKPPWFRDYLGALQEYAYSDWSGWSVDTETIGRADKGTDFPGGVDTKGAWSVNQPPRLMITKANYERRYADNDEVKVFVLGWIKGSNDRGPSGNVDILGAIRRETFEAKRFEGDWGKGPTWFVHHTHLEPMAPVGHDGKPLCPQRGLF